MRMNLSVALTCSVLKMIVSYWVIFKLINPLEWHGHVNGVVFVIVDVDV